MTVAFSAIEARASLLKYTNYEFQSNILLQDAAYVVAYCRRRVRPKSACLIISNSDFYRQPITNYLGYYVSISLHADGFRWVVLHDVKH
jgi:hypothetical protein